MQDRADRRGGDRILTGERNSMLHKFRIGQTVHLTRDNLRVANDNSFRILALRPFDGDDPLYLVKSDAERCQRIIAQSAIKRDPN